MVLYISVVAHGGCSLLGGLRYLGAAGCKNLLGALVLIVFIVPDLICTSIPAIYSRIV